MTRGAVAAALVTALLAFAALAFRAETVTTLSSPGDLPYAPAFRGETSGPGAMMNAHDGQAFGSLALDPLLARPGEWGGGRSQMAYRASRPLLGWLVGLTSFGSRRVAGWSLLAWTAVGAGVMAAGAHVLACRWGRRSDWVPLLLLLPGVLGQLLVGGLSDGLGTGLALLGLAWWLEHRDRWAIVALCLAALCRETTLVVPLAALASADWRRARPLLLPFVAYAGWVGLVWMRLHALPADPAHGRLAFPLTGFAGAVRSWSWVEVVSAVAIGALAMVAFRRAPCREVRWLVLVSALLATTFGAAVWRGWDFTRPLLPVTVVGACLLAGKAIDRTAPSADDAEAVPLLT